MGLTFLWGLLLGIGILFFPESPRYDYRHGKIDRAKKTLTKLYGVPENHRVIVNEFLEIKEQFEEEQSKPNVNWFEMFSAPKMARRILLGVVLQALQQLTGANYFFYYGTVVFNGAGISNSYVTQVKFSQHTSCVALCLTSATPIMPSTPSWLKHIYAALTELLTDYYGRS